MTGNTKDVFLIYGIVVTELFSLYTISFHFVKLSLAFTFFFFTRKWRSHMTFKWGARRDVWYICYTFYVMITRKIIVLRNTSYVGKKIYLGKIILKAIFQIYKTINMFCLKDNFISKIFDLISYLIWDMRIFAKLHPNDWKYQLLQ